MLEFIRILVIESILLFLLVFVISILINKLTNFIFKLLPYKMRFLYFITGIIGTVLHEMAHIIMCIIFRHKVVRFKLLQYPNEEGCMGYVSHSYNKKSIYQLIGLYFIGIAPIIIGFITIMISFYLLEPNIFAKYYQLINLYTIKIGDISLINSITTYYSFHKSFILLIFTLDYSVFKTWLLIFIIISITFHMGLSSYDIRNSLKGLPYIFIFLLLLNIVCYYYFTQAFYYNFYIILNLSIFALLILSSGIALLVLIIIPLLLIRLLLIKIIQ